jgi:1,4-alpha-glucan branching enzyme
MERNASKGRKRVRFQFVSQPGSEVFVAGSFNNWDPKATKLVAKDGNGTFSTSLLLTPGTYEYKFVVNNQWHLDPQNHQHRASAVGAENNVVKV